MVLSDMVIMDCIVETRCQLKISIIVLSAFALRHVTLILKKAALIHEGKSSSCILLMLELATF
jgi:hypothetical protein